MNVCMYVWMLETYVCITYDLVQGPSLLICVCIYVGMCTCACVHVSVCMYVYVSMHTRMNEHVNVCLYTCSHDLCNLLLTGSVCMCLHVCVCARIHE